MLGICLRLYVSEAQRHDGKLLHEWLLEQAKALGIGGGTAIRAIDGYGRHGRLHEETFFELAGELAVKVEFILDDKQAGQMLQRVGAQNLTIFYTRHEVQSGIV